MAEEAKEFEHKFLVEGDAWRQGECTVIRQGYLNTDEERTVRVRTLGNRGYMTVKGTTKGVTRDEYEYEIPIEDSQRYA